MQISECRMRNKKTEKVKRGIKNAIDMNINYRYNSYKYN